MFEIAQLKLDVENLLLFRYHHVILQIVEARRSVRKLAIAIGVMMGNAPGYNIDQNGDFFPKSSHVKSLNKFVCQNPS